MVGLRSHSTPCKLAPPVALDFDIAAHCPNMEYGVGQFAAGTIADTSRLLAHSHHSYSTGSRHHFDLGSIRLPVGSSRSVVWKLT